MLASLPELPEAIDQCAEIGLNILVHDLLRWINNTLVSTEVETWEVPMTSAVRLLRGAGYFHLQLEPYAVLSPADLFRKLSEWRQQFPAHRISFDGESSDTIRIKFHSAGPAVARQVALEDHFQLSEHPTGPLIVCIYKGVAYLDPNHRFQVGALIEALGRIAQAIPEERYAPRIRLDRNTMCIVTTNPIGDLASSFGPAMHRAVDTAYRHTTEMRAEVVEGRVFVEFTVPPHFDLESSAIETLDFVHSVPVSTSGSPELTRLVVGLNISPLTGIKNVWRYSTQLAENANVCPIGDFRYSPSNDIHITYDAPYISVL